MAMPHVVQMQLIKDRLKGKFGKSRLKELGQILLELPGYKTGPYGEIRSWIAEEMEKSKISSSTLCRDDYAVKKEGASQIVLIGPPNIGKSSLLNALSNKQIKIANYAFTTTRPVASSILYSGIPIQLIEIPGLIKGASEDKGTGKRLISVARCADAIVYIHDLTKEPYELEQIREELRKAGIKKPSIIIGNKSDLATEEQKTKAIAQFGTIIFVSATTKEGLEALKDEIWKLTGIIRVYTKDDEKPTGLKKGSTVMDLAERIHKEIANRLRTAKVTGSSAKFPNQTVSKSHILADNDRVKLIED
jgi:small GTP-binding protein